MRTVLCVILAIGAPAFAGPADPPAAPGSLAHRPVADGGGALLTWLEPAGEDRAMALRLSRFDGEAWTEPVTVRTGDDFFANWADLPSAHRAPDGSLVVSWLQKSGPGTYAYDIMLARSADDGATWETLGAAHRDGTPTEHGFVSMLDDPNGVRLVWLDGRNMAPGGGGHDAHAHGAGGDMTVRTNVLTADGFAAPSVMLDPRTCECCATDAALTSAGPVIVYRDRSETEVRDIAIVRLVDGQWTPPALVASDGWRIPACPVNGPAIDADGDDVVVAWFTGAGGGRVQAAFSSDAGATFGAPIVIAEPRPGKTLQGRVDVEFLRKDAAVVTFMGSSGSIWFQHVAPSGRIGHGSNFATTEPIRASGFPKIVPLEGGRLLATWTEVKDRTTRVRAMVVER
ncbi:MAG: hypothetical protein ACF8QF_07565 [Phycisphaerales bacterium]